MTAVVPSLTGSLYVKDPLSVISYTLRKFFRTPAHAVPLIPDLIISLPYLVARFGNEPENLASNIRSDLQACFTRVFGSDRTVQVDCSYTDDTNGNYIVTISVTYSMLSGEIGQTGTHVKLVNGRLQIPEDAMLQSFI